MSEPQECTAFEPDAGGLVCRRCRVAYLFHAGDHNVIKVHGVIPIPKGLYDDEHPEVDPPNE